MAESDNTKVYRLYIKPHRNRCILINISGFLEQQPKHENIAINSVKNPNPHGSDIGK